MSQTLVGGVANQLRNSQAGLLLTDLTKESGPNDLLPTDYLVIMHQLLAFMLQISRDIAPMP